MSIHKLFRCPYCARRGSVGVVVIDLDAMNQLPLGLTETNVLGSLGQERPPDVFLFNPDGVPNGPCLHLISCLLDASVLRLRRKRVVARPRSFTLSWDHCWFARHDTEQDLNAFLWIELEDGIDDAFDPTTPYVNPRIEWAGRLPGRKGVVEVSGTMFFASDAERFLSELQDGYRRMQRV